MEEATVRRLYSRISEIEEKLKEISNALQEIKSEFEKKMKDASSQRWKVMEAINELVRSYGEKPIPIKEIVKISAQKGVDKQIVDEIVNEEKRRGHLYEPKKEHVKIAR